MERKGVTAARVTSQRARESALALIEEVYRVEKGWIANSRREIPADIGARRGESWFLVEVGGEAAGAIRLLYDPELALPAEYGVELEPGVDLERLRQAGRFVDVGRFMILPRFRRDVRVALELMKAAIREVTERGYTHLLTDVFESDPHSPLRFHTRVLGFERIGTHRHGELACESVRILLILDIARAYARLKERGNRVFRELGEGLGDALAPAGLPLARSA